MMAHSSSFGAWTDQGASMRIASGLPMGLPASTGVEGDVGSRDLGFMAQRRYGNSKVARTIGGRGIEYPEFKA